MKKLTIGMATYDDYDGVFFTIQALRMYHPICATNQVEFVVIDNNPNSPQGHATKQFIEVNVKGKYIPFTQSISSFTKYRLADYASGEYVLGIDSHVLLKAGAIDALLKYYDEHPNCNDLIQGPLLYDDLVAVSTHFNDEFRGHMYGTWGTNPIYKEDQPFEILMNGMGLFSFRRDAWKGINQNFRGFGAEEGYIQAKFRQWGGTTICLPALQWNHRFARPIGIPYKLKLEDRVYNYFLGWLEIHPKDHPFIKAIYDHFKQFLPIPVMDHLLLEAENTLNPCKYYILEVDDLPVNS